MKTSFALSTLLILFAGGLWAEIDKAKAIATTMIVKNVAMFDFLALQQGRGLHEHLRGVSFAEANNLIRSGKLVKAYGELQDLMTDTVGGAGNLLIEESKEFKEIILIELSEAEIDEIYGLLPKGDLRSMNDLGKLEPIFELNPRFSNLFWEFQMADGMMSERTMSFLSSDQYRNYLKDGFDKILTKHGYPLVISIDAEADIKGMWTHINQKEEIVEITRQGEGYVATKKVSTDNYVPQGETTFFFDLDFNNCKIQFAQENFTNPFLVDCKVFKISEDRIILSGPVNMGGFQLDRKF